MVTRPNYLKTMVWGRRPKSAKRRRAAMWCCLRPSLLYLGCIALSVPIFQYTNILDEDEKSLGVLFCAWLFGIIGCNFMPFLLEKSFGNASILQANFHDYRLAGISGRDMLTGLAAPQLAGIKIFVATYGLSFFVLWLWIGWGSDKAIFAGIVGAIPTAAAIYNLLAGSHYSLAQWAICPKKANRVLKTAGFIFACPITLCTFCPILIVGFLLWVPLQFASYVMRNVYFENAWDRAQALLDGTGEEPASVLAPAHSNSNFVKPDKHNTFRV